MAKEKKEGTTTVKLSKRYQFGTGKDAVVVPAGVEVELTPEQLANVDKKDIVRDEKN